MAISILIHTALKRINNRWTEKYRCKEWAEMKWNQNKTNQHILKPQIQKGIREKRNFCLKEKKRVDKKDSLLEQAKWKFWLYFRTNKWKIDIWDFFLSLYLQTIKVNITNKVVSSTQVLFYHSQPVRRNIGRENFKRHIWLTQALICFQKHGQWPFKSQANYKHCSAITNYMLRV